MHDCRWGRVTPAKNMDFWQNKRKGNCDRDEKALQALKKQGWSSYIVWECDLKDEDRLVAGLHAFLDGDT
jgi:DNA mismatch endonuclease (patch repair protein)